MNSRLSKRLGEMAAAETAAAGSNLGKEIRIMKEAEWPCRLRLFQFVFIFSLPESFRTTSDFLIRFGAGSASSHIP